MLERAASTRGATRSLICLVLWGLAGGCATYENTVPDTSGMVGSAGGDAGASGRASSDVAGSAGSSVGGAPTTGGGATAAGMAGKGGGAGGVAGNGAGAGGTPSGGAGAGGAGQAGSGGVAGAGGGGGKAGGGSGGSAGNGGSGGSAAVQTCAKNPVSVKSKWVVTASASSNADPTSNAHDGVLTNRWTTGTEQVGDEWLQLDFGAIVTLTRVTLVLGASVNDYPRKYATRFSNTAMNQAAPVLVSGMGAVGSDTTLNFPKGTTGRYR